MAGRRAFPYSVEAEDQLAPKPGRRKASWIDRTKFFDSFDAAIAFAARRAVALQRRQRVQAEWSYLGAAPLWTVRATSGSVVLPLNNASLYLSLDRMEREA